MKTSHQRIIARSLHLLFSIPVIGYIYSPFRNLPDYAPMVRYLAIPVLAASGFWMLKQRAFRQV